MKLIDDFYDILSRQEVAGDTLFTVALRPDCKVYDGHFPGSPVAPGVCNIQMLTECAAEVAGHPLRLIRIAQCRMTKLITPADSPTLVVRIHLDGESLTATIERGEESCLTLKGTVA